MEQIENAILRTVLYADVFDFALTAAEIHHFLIHDKPVSLVKIEQTLCESAYLKNALMQSNGYVAYAGREEIIMLRQQREHIAAQLWPDAITYGRWLARLPFVRLTALTGALSMHNAHEHDDFDYLLITSAGRVWLARLFAVALVRLVKLRGRIICPNYVLAETALEQKRQDLFIAHEITQMVPIFGADLYQQMRCANLWTERHLPNATFAYYQEEQYVIGTGWQLIKRGLEFLLSGKLGDVAERWEHRRKLKRFANELKTPNSSALLDHSQVKGHFQDHGHPVLNKYMSKLEDYGLVGTELPSAGD